MEQMNKTLDEIEDAHSGVKKDPSPPRGPTDRMYPAQSDSIVHEADGSITASSRNHTTTYGSDGSITVTERSTGTTVYKKSGN
jgi:hypothetical protein